MFERALLIPNNTYLGGNRALHAGNLYECGGLGFALLPPLHRKESSLIHIFGDMGDSE